MNQEHLTSLLAAATTDASDATNLCPDPEVVAGYVDGGLERPEREKFERHLADCAHCLDLVGLLARERGANDVEPVPEEMLDQARSLVIHEPRRRWAVAPRWAAAAALVLAVPLLLQLGREVGPGEGGVPGADQLPDKRAIESTSTPLRIISPAGDSVVDPRTLAFRWTPVSGTPYYDVRIVSDTGDVIVEQRVSGTTWQPPAGLRMRPGTEYFVHVDAYPSGDKAVSSGHVPFRLAN